HGPILGSKGDLKMTEPTNVKVDFQAKAGYVRYREAQATNTIDVWEDGAVAVDLDDTGNVVGIEVLALDGETLAQAQKYAAAHDLAFPAHLEGALVFA
ncbi:MAG: DUF2283 domain-containing protein, partial [Candidatus Baltobacteraceae bacterium]